MTSTSAIYGTIYDFLTAEMGAETLERLLHDWITQKPGKSSQVTGTKTGELLNLCALLRDDIRTQANKASGKANITRGARAILERAKKSVANPGLHGAIMRDGGQYVSDGYTLMRIDTPLELPAAPIDSGLKVVDLLSGARSEACEDLPLPTVGELSAHIKQIKAERGRGDKQAIIWDFGDGFPLVNAVYLLDILTAFPSASCRWCSVIKPLYFECSDGAALLLPIHRKEGR